MAIKEYNGISRSDLIDRFEAIHLELRNAHSIAYLINNQHDDIPDVIITAGMQIEAKLVAAKEQVSKLHGDLVSSLSEAHESTGGAS